MTEMSLDEIKNCTLDILKWVDGFCTEHDIKWWLCGGTLLGAARHQGFIPWDDDIDIMMPREEYDRLFQIFPENGRYRFLRSDNTEDFPYSYGKIVDTETVKLEPLPKQYQKIGVDIDVFPIDNYPKDDNDAMLLCDAVSNIQYKLQLMFSQVGSGRNLIRTLGHNLKAIFFTFLRVSRIVKISRFTREIQELSQKYNREDTGYKGIITIAHYGIKEKNKASVYAQSVMVEFEGREYPAPIGYQSYLSKLYGDDYMQLPPIEKRMSHHSYIAYWK